MTLKEYHELLGNLIKRGHGNLKIIYAVDDEGNGYHDVFFGPSVFKVEDIKDVYDGHAKGSVICLN